MIGYAYDYDYDCGRRRGDPDGVPALGPSTLDTLE